MGRNGFSPGPGFLNCDYGDFSILMRVIDYLHPSLGAHEVSIKSS
jgi:hypothetical protein